MAEYEGDSSKVLSVSSSENRHSVDSSIAEADEGDEEFYEKIEAPKFVDFTVPDHYRPDDRYWFCLRVGCDQKHEEEMDSEAIHKNFVLRVMAARSPNVRLRKALDRKASRTLVKCPLSAPPKSCKPRLSRIAIISSISKKMVDDKDKDVKPLLKSGSTPVIKTKPVAAKYLTTPRNRKTISDQNSSRSVEHPKPSNVEVETRRTVAKALAFYSPKKATKVKTSVELRTPISKLCEGMNKLEISSQRKGALGYSSKLSKNLSNGSSKNQLSSRRVQRKHEEPFHSQTYTNQEAQSGRSIETTKIQGKLSQQQASMKLLGIENTHNLTDKESRDIKQQLTKNVTEEIEFQELSHGGACVSSSTVPPPTQDSDMASPDESRRDVNCLDIEGGNDSRPQAANPQENNSIPEPSSIQENNCNDGNENLTSESSRESVGHLNVNNSSEEERNGHEFMEYDDDKENASASDGNRIHNNNLKQNGRRIFCMQDKCGQVQKKVTQAQNKNLKDAPSDPVMKLKKPQATNPKPFRLRTDERRIFKEAKFARRTDPLAPQCEAANSSTSGGKLQRKQGNDIQKGSMILGLKTPKGKERSKAAASVTPENNRHQERKLIGSPLESNAMKRLEKFRKLTSPLPKHSVRPQGLVATKQEMISYLIPGQKLDVIHEISPEVFPEPRRRAGKPTENGRINDATACAASRSSSRGRRPITSAREPNSHAPRSFTKKLK